MHSTRPFKMERRFIFMLFEDSNASGSALMKRIVQPVGKPLGDAPNAP